MVFGELEDQASASFPLCLSILETVSQVNLFFQKLWGPSFKLLSTPGKTCMIVQVKCCVLLLDLDADDIVSEIFSSLFGAIK